ncbi:MAG: M28 family peptidase [Deltaproteobacteria bacterium]|nr:M28 family peptidase [Deltaproteobacteria bacterium]
MKRFRGPVLAAGGFAAALAGGAAFLVQPVWPGERAGPPVNPDPARLERDVRALVAIPPGRGQLQVDGLDRAAAFITDELRAAGLAPADQPYVVEARTYRNVRARLGTGKGPLVVVGAHYDTCEALPGADDNASGVAGLLELARLLVVHPPQAPVELVAWSLEEPPHFRKDSMGSAHHAAWLAGQGAAVRAALSVEMIGVFSDEPGTQRFPFAVLGLLYGTTADFVAVVGDTGQVGLVRKLKGAMASATTLSVRSINAPRVVQGIDFSDHLNFWKHGWPAVMVTDTSFNRYPHYHEATDTPEKLDYRRMAEVVRGLFSGVHALAAAP